MMNRENIVVNTNIIIRIRVYGAFFLDKLNERTSKPLVACLFRNRVDVSTFLRQRETFDNN